MKVLENIQINLTDYNINSDCEVSFLRIDPEDLSIALKDILNELANFSWLSRFDKEFVKISMETNARKTCDYLKERFYDKDLNPIISEAGEYIVSVYSKRGLVEELSHLDVPLAELIGRKRSGNPGFDFFTEKGSIELITCGEAKYVHGSNAYNSSLTQINDFIKDKKHKSDAIILNQLVSDNSLTNLVNDVFGVCAAFSSTNIDTKILLKNISENDEFKKTLKYKYVILVAVNI